MSFEPSASVAYSQGNVTWYLVDRISSEWARIRMLNDRNRSPVFKAGETNFKQLARAHPEFLFWGGGGLIPWLYVIYVSF